jgi:hypothetical protein
MLTSPKVPIVRIIPSCEENNSVVLVASTWNSFRYFEILYFKLGLSQTRIEEFLKPKINTRTFHA